ncbi:carbohydrate ABC transporter permease [Aestuariivirga sp. YIM B02566]|uniref:Carbohydrate ABC transporter permease n=1 Tax=Taklimakanibacter albus TaxID=2800327 RepID=A0ACC5RDL2_9HYPH|nr:carbohydrate ABC transporter permease [Aestuariivirga sp. YIM B02566]MBK1870679.1 carbohydrate ABC transporter permease [Aestuariivirga sp. YIM B02566]
MRIKRRTLGQIASFTTLALISAVFLAPVIWIALTALKTQREALALPPVWSFTPQWHNFIEAWQSNDFAKSFLITTSVSIFSVALTLALSIPLGYVLARYRRGWLSAFEVAIMVVRMLPEILFMLPLYVIYQKTALFDTQIGIILAFQIFNIPYCAWLTRQFISEVPPELDEAALLDGASLWQVLWFVIVPTIRPGIVAAAVLSFIAVWTNLLLPLALTYSETPMVATTIANFKGYGSFNWPVMAAAAIISLLPQFIFFLFAQKYIVKGLTLGAVKG